jgi:hypothetical protein
LSEKSLLHVNTAAVLNSLLPLDKEIAAFDAPPVNDVAENASNPVLIVLLSSFRLLLADVIRESILMFLITPF